MKSNKRGDLDQSLESLINRNDFGVIRVSEVFISVLIATRMQQVGFMRI